MSERFGGTALRLYGLAARQLGWRPDDFWGATPAELIAAFAAPDAGEEPLSRTLFEQMMEHDDARFRQ